LSLDAKELTPNTHEHGKSNKQRSGNRHELAMHYIRETRRPAGEISCLSGFSESSNLTRAFKRRGVKHHRISVMRLPAEHTFTTPIDTISY
jgi:hypothetical protein